MRELVIRAGIGMATLVVMAVLMVYAVWKLLTDDDQGGDQP